VSAARLDRFYLSHGLRSKLIESVIRPVGFSDHHLITVTISLMQNITRSQWHFNNKLLQDVTFCENFKILWQKWKEKRSLFESLNKWWEVGKAQIRIFCQQYTSFSSTMLKQAINEVEEAIKQIENGLLNGGDAESNDTLKIKRVELSSLLQEKVKGALVRSRYIQLKDMDASSTFFFNLEKTDVKNQRMTCLRCPDGHVTTDGGEMRRCAALFYTELYGKEQCDEECVQELLEGLPKLSGFEQTELDKELSLEELTIAVNQLTSGRSPGIDGLSIDFFKHFWGTIGSDVHEVLMSSFEQCLLPTSCRRAVLTLLPKKGDLSHLKNWRPVALLCTEYKVLSRALSNRLKPYIGSF